MDPQNIWTAEEREAVIEAVTEKIDALAYLMREQGGRSRRKLVLQRALAKIENQGLNGA